MLTAPFYCRVVTLVGLCALSTGCAPALSPLPTRDSAAQVSRLQQDAPPGAAPGTCWDKQVTPAIIETVTHQIMLQPAEIHSDGTVVSPAIFKTETVQQIVRERTETWFETPCDDVLTPEFIASLQRALKVRRLYRGAITGRIDNRTQSAIRKYQAQQGLDSTVLSLSSARKLGLVEIQRD